MKLQVRQGAGANDFLGNRQGDVLGRKYATPCLLEMGLVELDGACRACLLLLFRFAGHFGHSGLPSFVRSAGPCATPATGSRFAVARTMRRQHAASRRGDPGDVSIGSRYPNG